MKRNHGNVTITKMGIKSIYWRVQKIVMPYQNSNTLTQTGVLTSTSTAYITTKIKDHNFVWLCAPTSEIPSKIPGS